MTLSDYTKNCVDSYGLLHTMQIRALRDYLIRTPLEQLIAEVALIPTAASMRALWEAGVPRTLQPAYFERLKMVI